MTVYFGETLFILVANIQDLKKAESRQSGRPRTRLVCLHVMEASSGVERLDISNPGLDIE